MKNKPQPTPMNAQKFAALPQPKQQAPFRANAAPGPQGKQTRRSRSRAVLFAWVLLSAGGALCLLLLIFASNTFLIILSYLVAYLLNLLWSILCLGGILLWLAFFLFFRQFGRAYGDPLSTQARYTQRMRRRRDDRWREPSRYPWVGRGV